MAGTISSKKQENELLLMMGSEAKVLTRENQENSNGFDWCTYFGQ